MIEIFSIFAIVIFAYYSSSHALGIWLIVMIVHGVIVLALGETGVHIPLYMGLGLTAVLYLKNELKNVNYQLVWLTFILLFLMSLSSMTGLNQTQSLVYVSLYLKGIFLAIIISAYVKDVNDIKLLSIYCLAGLVFGALVTVYQYITGNYSIDGYYLKRAAGLREDPNDTAMLLLAGLPIATYWVYKSKNYFYKILSLISIMLLLIGIGLTNSRGGFVTLVILIFLIYLKRPNFKNTVIGMLIVISAALLAPESYWDRMNSLLTGKEDHGGKSISSRMELVKRGSAIFLDNAILGVGPGNFGQALGMSFNESGGKSAAVETRADSTGSAAHNMYLEYFVENGIISGLLFLYIIFRSIINYLNFDKISELTNDKEIYGLGYSLSMSIVAMSIASIFLSQGKNSVLWFLIGIGFSMICINKQKYMKKPHKSYLNE